MVVGLLVGEIIYNDFTEVASVVGDVVIVGPNGKVTLPVKSPVKLVELMVAPATPVMFGTYKVLICGL